MTWYFCFSALWIWKPPRSNLQGDSGKAAWTVRKILVIPRWEQALNTENPSGSTNTTANSSWKVSGILHPSSCWTQKRSKWVSAWFIISIEGKRKTPGSSSVCFVIKRKRERSRFCVCIIPFSRSSLNFGEKISRLQTTVACVFNSKK